MQGAGDEVGINVQLNPEPDKYFSYTRSYYGIYVAIHDQDDYPDMSSSIVAQPGYNVKSLITPYVISSDEAVRNLCSFI